MFKEGIFLICFQSILSIFVSLGLLVYFKNPNVKNDVLVTVMVGWIFGFAGILLLPYDLSVAIVNKETVSNLKNVLKFSDDFVDFLLKILVIRSSGRMTIPTMLKHPWLRDEVTSAEIDNDHTTFDAL